MILWRMDEGDNVDLQHKGVVWKHHDGGFLLSFAVSHCRWLTEKERIELWRKRKKLLLSSRDEWTATLAFSLCTPITALIVVNR